MHAGAVLGFIDLVGQIHALIAYVFKPNKYRPNKYFECKWEGHGLPG